MGEKFIPEDSDKKDFYYDSDPSTKRIRSGRAKHYDGTDDYDKFYDELGPSRHLTVFFNTFVFMQVFNEFNARKINDEINIFENINKSQMFLGIWVIIVIVQTLMVEFGGYAINCNLDVSQFYKKGLTVGQWFICIAFGVGSLVWGFILRWIPNKKFLKLEKVEVQNEESKDTQVFKQNSSLFRNNK